MCFFFKRVVEPLFPPHYVALLAAIAETVQEAHQRSFVRDTNFGAQTGARKGGHPSQMGPTDPMGQYMQYGADGGMGQEKRVGAIWTHGKC